MKPRRRGSIRPQSKPEVDGDADLTVFDIVLRRKRKQPDETFKTLKPRKTIGRHNQDEYVTAEEVTAHQEARAKVEKLRSSRERTVQSDSSVENTPRNSTRRSSQSSSSRRLKASSGIDSHSDDNDDDADSVGSSLSFSSRIDNRGQRGTKSVAIKRRSIRSGNAPSRDQEPPSEAESQDRQSDDGLRSPISTDGENSSSNPTIPKNKKSVTVGAGTKNDDESARIETTRKAEKTFDKTLYDTIEYDLETDDKGASSNKAQKLKTVRSTYVRTSHSFSMKKKPVSLLRQKIQDKGEPIDGQDIESNAIMAMVALRRGDVMAREASPPADEQTQTVNGVASDIPKTSDVVPMPLDDVVEKTVQQESSDENLDESRSESNRDEIETEEDVNAETVEIQNNVVRLVDKASLKDKGSVDISDAVSDKVFTTPSKVVDVHEYKVDEKVSCTGVALVEELSEAIKNGGEKAMSQEIAHIRHVGDAKDDELVGRYHGDDSAYCRIRVPSALSQDCGVLLDTKIGSVDETNDNIGGAHRNNKLSFDIGVKADIDAASNGGIALSYETQPGATDDATKFDSSLELKDLAAHVTQATISLVVDAFQETNIASNENGDGQKDTKIEDRHETVEKHQDQLDITTPGEKVQVVDPLRIDDSQCDGSLPKTRTGHYQSHMTSAVIRARLEDAISDNHAVIDIHDIVGEDNRQEETQIPQEIVSQLHANGISACVNDITRVQKNCDLAEAVQSRPVKKSLLKNSNQDAIVNISVTLDQDPPETVAEKTAKESWFNRETKSAVFGLKRQVLESVSEGVKEIYGSTRLQSFEEALLSANEKLDSTVLRNDALTTTATAQGVPLHQLSPNSLKRTSYLKSVGQVSNYQHDVQRIKLEPFPEPEDNYGDILRKQEINIEAPYPSESRNHASNDYGSKVEGSGTSTPSKYSIQNVQEAKDVLGVQAADGTVTDDSGQAHDSTLDAIGAKEQVLDTSGKTQDCTTLKQTPDAMTTGEARHEVPKAIEVIDDVASDKNVATASESAQDVLMRELEIADAANAFVNIQESISNGPKTADVVVADETWSNAVVIQTQDYILKAQETADVLAADESSIHMELQGADFFPTAESSIHTGMQGAHVLASDAPVPSDELMAESNVQTQDSKSTAQQAAQKSTADEAMSDASVQTQCSSVRQEAENINEASFDASGQAENSIHTAHEGKDEVVAVETVSVASVQRQETQERNDALRVAVDDEPVLDPSGQEQMETEIVVAVDQSLSDASKQICIVNTEREAAVETEETMPLESKAGPGSRENTSSDNASREVSDCTENLPESIELSSNNAVDDTCHEPISSLSKSHNSVHGNCDDTLENIIAENLMNKVSNQAPQDNREEISAENNQTDDVLVDMEKKIYRSLSPVQNAEGVEGIMTKQKGDDHSNCVMENRASRHEDGKAGNEVGPVICRSLSLDQPNCQEKQLSKRSRSESPKYEENESNKRLCKDPTGAQFLAEGADSHVTGQEIAHEVTGIETTSYRRDLEKVKLAIFELGKRVHKAKKYDLLFLKYWTAISLKLSGILSVSEMARNQLLIRRFLKNTKLRTLHNKLILGLLERCANRDFTESDIPLIAVRHAGSRVKSSQCPKAKSVEKPRSTLSIRKEPPAGQQRKIIKKDEDKDDSMLDPFSSSRIPGALLIDPYVRVMAQAQGVRISENAVWLIVVAVKEYTRLLLSDCLDTAKSLESSGSVGPMKSTRLPINLTEAAWRDKAVDDSSENQLTPSCKPKTKPLSSLDVHAVLSRMPIAARSLAGCVSRITYERSVQACHFGNQCKSWEISPFEDVRRFCFSKIAPPPQRPKEIVKPTEMSQHNITVGTESQASDSLKFRLTSLGNAESGSGKIGSPVADLSKSSPHSSALVALSEGQSETISTDVATSPSGDGATTLVHSEPTTNLAPRSPGKGAGIKNLAAMRARSTCEENSVTETTAIQP